MLVRTCDYCCRCRLVKAGCWMMMKECRPLLLLKVKASNDMRFVVAFLPAYFSDTRSRNLYTRNFCKSTCSRNLHVWHVPFCASFFCTEWNAAVFHANLCKIWHRNLHTFLVNVSRSCVSAIRHITGPLFHWLDLLLFSRFALDASSKIMRLPTQSTFLTKKID